MPDLVEESERRGYSEWTFAVPFGQYEAGGDQEAPADEVLIGREGQRAYLIDLLFNMGRRGAYLVTGRRGAGKTSFIRHCIAEYRAEVFGRFVRSSVGRALFWDRAIVLALGVAAVVGALLLSQLMALLVGSIAHQPISPPTVLVWLVIAPMALLCFYPLLYAKEVLEVVAGARRQEDKQEDQRGRLFAISLLAGIVCVVWYLGPFGSAELGLSRLFTGICAMYLLMQLTSYRSLRGLPEREAPPSRAMWLHGLILLPVAVYVLFGAALLPSGPRDEFWLGLGSGFLLLSIGAGLRGIHISTTAAGDHHQVPRVGGKEARAMQDSAFWYFFLTVAAAGAGFLVIALDLGGLAMSGCVVLVAASLGIGYFWWQRIGRDRKLSFKPRPLQVLSAKAVVSIVLSLQLVHPLVALWPLSVDTGSRHSFRSEVSLHELSSRESRHARSSGAMTSAHLGIFHDQRQELAWILALLLSSGVIFFLEYEWVLRPFLRQRIDRTLAPDSPAPWEDQWTPEEHHDRRRAHRDLASMTLPWLINNAWLPVFVLSVNLGFDRLDHRRVVHAMLTALRDVYHRTFLAWSSLLANLGRFVGALVLLVAVSLVGERLFEIHEADLGKQAQVLSGQAAGGYPDPCRAFQGRQLGASVASLICGVPGGDRLFHWLYFDLLGNPTVPHFKYGDHLLFTFFPYEEQDFPAGGLPPLLARGLHFRVYHVLLLGLFWLIGRWLFHRLPIFPYQETLNRIDAMLDNLSARTSQSSKKTHGWKLAQWLQGYFTDESVREKQQDPVDPRTVEFALLSILQDIQSASLRLPGAKNQLISLPAPEITFIFDELDKLGTRLGPQEAAAGGSKQEAEILDAERRRSLELHKLLANMKNLLSSAPARFIFVGGRNMHDEWLADQTARHPQLTNIFNAEIYLPSLVTDHRRDRPAKLHDRVEEFLLQQERRARILYCRWVKTRWLPSFAVPLRDLDPESFVPTRAGGNRRSAPDGSRLPELLELNDLQVLRCHDGSEALVSADFAPSLLRDFVYFMTYRSMGNPKKLKELMASFVRPVGRVVRAHERRWTAPFDCRHVLQFGDLERFRVQLLADVYRHLALTAEERLVYRDDKVAISVFYLADFLFKFHGRAFSWSNLEKVDELIHIHRAPDLREVLEEIVERWSERFLHSIRNGMYAFRFRSDIAREVEYLSRQSAYEMAAFNFTLDESQALKSLYESRIQQLEPRADQELQDLVAGLGELHEFDQEYETARLYYRRAIKQLDAELARVLGQADDGAGNRNGVSPVQAILEGNARGLANARLDMTWSVARLRLMLQVGMTFEHTRNLERAAVEYRNARTLARSVILALLGQHGPWEALSESSVPTGEQRLHMIKNLNLLFQPAFAEAWVAEKLPGSVDTSITLVEKELAQVRALLPFVRDRELPLSTDLLNVSGSNFALIVAELHNKAGDLCFFKGRQLVSVDDLRKIATLEAGEIRKGCEGYLLRAHYHYAMALHELRRFATHRRESSKFKFNIWSFEESKLWPTISAGSWPDFVFRSVGGTLNDLAESMLGRVSLFGLFKDLSRGYLIERPASREPARPAPSPKVIKTALNFAFGAWLEYPEQPDTEEFRIRIPIGDQDLDAGTLTSWLGRWQGTDGSPRQHLGFTSAEGHNDAQRLLVSLHFSMVGAKYLERGGYLEDAATELLEVGETVAHYLWWGLQINRLDAWRCSSQRNLPKMPDGGPVPLDLCGQVFTATVLREPYWDYALRLALYALRKADQLFRRSRRDEQSKTGNLIGDKIPPSLLTLTCSIGIAARLIDELPPASTGLGRGELFVRLTDLINGWLGTSEKPEQMTRIGRLSTLLEESLIRYGYPMINRLFALKVLIDTAVLDQREWTEKQKRIVLAQASELLQLAGQFNAPMHFTPLQTGITCALVDLRCRAAGESNRWRVAEKETEQLRQAAQRDLKTSEEMYTMRRAYYEAISDLYYLFDDFNDRQIHFNAAIQMAGTEIVSLLKGLLHLPAAVKFRQEDTAPV